VAADDITLPEGLGDVCDRLRKQRQEALNLANERRVALAALRNRIRTKELNVLMLLEGHLEEEEFLLGRATVESILMAIPRFGPLTVKAIMAELDMTTATRFGALSKTRRADLAATVRGVMGR
jgi:hypothetical protein